MKKKKLRSQWLEKIKNWTKKTMVEKYERLNKVKIAKKLEKIANDMTQKELL